MSKTSKLKAWRQAQGLSARDLATKVGVSRITVHSWERGASIPPPELMRRLVELTGGAVQPNDFYTITLTLNKTVTSTELAAA